MLAARILDGYARANITTVVHEFRTVRKALANLIGLYDQYYAFRKGNFVIKPAAAMPARQSRTEHEATAAPTMTTHTPSGQVPN
jgi:hypothetical protein